MIDPQSVPHLPGVPVLDVDGDLIGSIDRVYIHQHTGAPLWVAIHSHVDGALNAFAPLEGARFDDQRGSALYVGLPRAVVENAPLIRSADTLTSDDVHALRAYYRSTSPAPTSAGGAPGADETDDIEVVRSEEQLRVSTISQPAERIRFQKVVVTEERTITVTVRREELRIIREPITDPGYDTAPDNTAAASDLEVVLHEEQAVVTTKAIPVERVRVRVAQVTEQLPVTDTVRRERVDIDTPPAH